MGMPKTSYPAPTAEERALQAKQLALMEASEAREKAWEPILLSEMGYRKTDEGGLEEIGAEEQYAGMSELEKQNYDLQKLAGERELKAMRGELPVDPAAERDIAEQEQSMKERMFRQLGQGWEASSPGIEAAATQGQRAAEIREAIRRGEMTTTEALAQSRGEESQRKQQQFMSSSAEPTNRSMAIMGGYETPKNWLERGREQQFEARKLKAQMKAQQMGQMSSGMGCCFNFLEAEGYIHEDIRKFRDEYFSQNGLVASGYKKMARWLVPLMRENKVVKFLVRLFMTRPLTAIAKCHYGKNRYGVLLVPLGYIWKGIWFCIGKYCKSDLYTWKEFNEIP